MVARTYEVETTGTLIPSQIFKRYIQCNTDKQVMDCNHLLPSCWLI